jgi:hypothetical protein
MAGLKPNHEWTEFHHVAIEELEDFVSSFTFPNTEIRFSEFRDNRVHPSSAALYDLVKRNKTYQSIMEEIENSKQSETTEDMT